MKRIILLILILFLGLSGVKSYAADVIPQTVSMVHTNTIGLYQASNEITLYAKPSDKSDIIHSIRWNNLGIFPASVKADELFVVYVPSKDLALLAVTDETEDWVEVMYNNYEGYRGWLKKDDPYRFMTWINFFNIYGKKYGLVLLKGVPEEVKDLRSSADQNSQVVGRINHPQKINLTAIRGNWALVSVYDLDRVPKTGYVRWRAENGTKYIFPAVK